MIPKFMNEDPFLFASYVCQECKSILHPNIKVIRTTVYKNGENEVERWSAEIEIDSESYIIEAYYSFHHGKYLFSAMRRISSGKDSGGYSSILTKFIHDEVKYESL